MALDGPPATFFSRGHNHKGIIRSNHEIINPELDGHQSGIPEFRGHHTELPAKLFQPYRTVQYPLFPIPSARNGIANKRSIQPRRPWRGFSIPSSPPSSPVAAWGWRRCSVTSAATAGRGKHLGRHEDRHRVGVDRQRRSHRLGKIPLQVTTGE